MKAAAGAWRALMPGWCPSVEELRKLDEGPPEFVAAVRALSQGWSSEDARWDVLMALFEYTRRTHAHELAEKIRAGKDERDAYAIRYGMNLAADLIDPKKESDD